MTTAEVKRNRATFLDAMRSGKYPKGTIETDDRGRPINHVVTNGDEGHCAVGLMAHLFYEYKGVESPRNYLIALDITTRDARKIQQEWNDSPLTFPEIADKVEAEIFNK
jgi:hypothetical protein